MAPAFGPHNLPQNTVTRKSMGILLLLCLAPSHFPLCEGPWAWDEALAGRAKPASEPTNRTKQLSQPKKIQTNQATRQPAKRTTIQKIEPSTDQVSNNRKSQRPTNLPVSQPTNQQANLTSQPNHRAGLEARDAGRGRG